MDAKRVTELVQQQLSKIGDRKLRDSITKHLVEPYSVAREWDYGHPGEKYLCWTVLEHHDSNTAIAYCEKGFGPGDPWGLVFLTGEDMNIGMDSCWYANLEDAFRESAAWDGENPPGYEVQ